MNSFRRIFGQLVVISLALWVLNALPMPSQAVIWHALYDAGHGPLFGVIALSLLALLRNLVPGGSLRRIYTGAFVITAGLGALTEFLQLFSPRDADLGDFLRNVSGAAAFLMVRGALERDEEGRYRLKPRSRRVGAFLGALVLIGAVFAPVALTGYAYRERVRRFPLLAGFDSRWEKTFVLPTRARLDWEVLPGRFGEPGRKVGRWTLYPQVWPGLRILEPVTDWSGRKAIRFEIWSELDEDLPMTLLVDDFRHRVDREDRSRTRFQVHPGHNYIRILLEEIRTDPEGLPLRMDQVAAVYLYISKPEKTFTLWIDSIGLE